MQTVFQKGAPAGTLTRGPVDVLVVGLEPRVAEHQWGEGTIHYVKVDLLMVTFGQQQGDRDSLVIYPR